jgi:hypothetical protein
MKQNMLTGIAKIGNILLPINHKGGQLTNQLKGERFAGNTKRDNFMGHLLTQNLQ